MTDDGTVDEVGTGKSGDEVAVEVEGYQDENAPTYDAQPHKPVVVDMQATDWNGNPAPRTLVEGTDYDVTYYNVDTNGAPVSGAQTVTPEGAGKKVAVVALKGNYTGTIAVRVDVKQRPVAFTGQTAERAYNGREQEITGFTVGQDGLVSGHTHNISYSAKGTNKGEYDGAFTYKDATAVIRDASGADVTANYMIVTTPGKLTITALDVDANGDGSADNLTDVDGDTVTEAGEPVPVVSLSGFDGSQAPVYDDRDHKPTVVDNSCVDPTTGKRESVTLTEGTDYRVDYYEANPDGTPNEDQPIDNTSGDAPKVAGNKVAVVKFIGNYQGALTVPVDVKKRPVTITGKTVVAFFDGKAHAMDTRISDFVDGVSSLVSVDPDNATADAATRKMTYAISGLVDTHTTRNSNGTDTVKYDIKDVQKPDGTNVGYPIDAGVYQGYFDGVDWGTIRIYRAGGTTDVTQNYDIRTTTGTYTILRVELHDAGEGRGVIPSGSGAPIPEDAKIIHAVGASGEAAPVYDGTPKEPVVTEKNKQEPLVRGVDYDVTYYAPGDVEFVRDDALGTDTRPQVKAGAHALTPEEAGEKIALIALRGRGNYTGTVAVRMDVKKRPVTITGDTDTKPYSGGAQSVVTYQAEAAAEGSNTGLVQGHSPANLYYSARGTDTGTYTGAFNPQAGGNVSIMKGDANVSPNYAVTLVVGSLTIVKANPVAEAPLATAVYGLTLKDVVLTNPEGNTEGTWAFEDPETTDVGNAGSHVFKAKFTPEDGSNYNAVEHVDVTVAVEKANPSVVAPSGSAVYGQTLKEALLPF